MCTLECVLNARRNEFNLCFCSERQNSARAHHEFGERAKKNGIAQIKANGITTTTTTTEMMTTVTMTAARSSHDEIVII